MSVVGDIAGKVAGGLGLDKVVDFGKDVIGGLTGEHAAEASRQAAQTQAQAQMQALNYLREREQLPQQFREGALGVLGGLYGLEGGEGRRSAMNTLESSPFYQAALGDLGAQEEAILRNQSATGALRSGATEQMLAENQRQREYGALQASLQPLQGLAGLQSYAPQIAQGISGVGQTQAQGILGAGQAKQEAIGGLLQGGMKAAAMAFSDIRLKDNVKPAGERYGHAWFTWDWNDRAETLGLSGSSEGVLAQEVAKTNPDAIGFSQGYLTVDYAKLESSNG